MAIAGGQGTRSVPHSGMRGFPDAASHGRTGSHTRFQVLTGVVPMTRQLHRKFPATSSTCRPIPVTLVVSAALPIAVR